MSLIALTSEGQNPAIFNSNFPQPIHMPTRSQICLQKFIHYRDSSIYSVNSANNVLYFVIGDTRTDAKRKVVVPPGEYTGTELASAIQTAMNSVLQQQYYTFAVTFAEKDSVSAGDPIIDTFTIEYDDAPAVSITGGTWDDNDDTFLTIVNNDIVNGVSTITNTGAVPGGFSVAKLTNGVLIHEGSLSVENIAYNIDVANPQRVFGDTTVGFCRDLLSNVDNANPNLRFDPGQQDISINFDEDVIDILVINEDANAVVGSPGWATFDLARTIPQSVYTQFTTAPNIASIRYKVVLTSHQVSLRAIIQLYVSNDTGVTYTAIANGTGGNDGNGSPYVATVQIGGTTFPSTIFDSSNTGFYDGGAGARISNLIQSKRAPYIPTVSFIETTLAGENWDFTSTDWSSFNGQRMYEFVPYTGVNGFDLVIQALNGTYTDKYVKYTGVPDQVEVWLIDEDVTNINPASLLTNSTAGSATSSWNFSVNIPQYSTNITPDAPLVYTIVGNTLNVYGVFNPVYRPVSSGLMNTPTYATGNDEHARIAIEGSSEAPEELNVNAPTLQRMSGLWLRRLTPEDISKNTTIPLYLKPGDSSGTIGNLIGTNKNVIAIKSPGIGLLFTSEEEPQKTSKDSTLHISINELPGVKSFEGGKSNTAKSIAIIPREEFASTDGNNSLVYVAPFENWIDMNNREMAVNLFSMEVRRPDGTIASDLQNNTYAVLKMRQDPTEREAISKQKAYDDLASKLSSIIQSGQILSQTLDMPNAQLGS